MTMTDAAPDRTDTAWCGFVVRLLAMFVAVLAVTLAFVILIDPYDSGRFPNLGISGVSDTTQRTENVSLGRSKKFNAAVFGNSHGQLLDPDRLTQATGLSFVQLTIPGAYAPEQLAMMRWFIRHHPRIGALVLAADARWCSADPQPWKWFPFWLYGDSDLQYLANSLNSRSVGAAFRRIKHAMGLLQPSHPRGYDDYERRLPPDYRFDFPPPAPAPASAAFDLGPRQFPAIDRLAAELEAAPAGTPPRRSISRCCPTTRNRSPCSRKCKARLARLAAARPRGGFLDLLVDSPIARDQASFDDIDHYARRSRATSNRRSPACSEGRPRRKNEWAGALQPLDSLRLAGFLRLRHRGGRFPQGRKDVLDLVGDEKVHPTRRMDEPGTAHVIQQPEQPIPESFEVRDQDRLFVAAELRPG
jgi:hypothetical protein